MEAYSVTTGRPRQRNTPSPCLFPGLAPLLLFGLLFGTGLAADRRDITSSPEISTESADALPETVQSRNEATEIAVETVANGNQNTDRTELNLLGEVDTESGESRRNENVQLTLVDNNVLKELNIRMGTSATIIREFEASNGYFGAEFGNPPVRQFHLAPANKNGFHGSIYEVHSNSQFQARSFFQVGGVKPARSNEYGLNILLPLGASTSLTVDASQRRTRGNVNGNVLVPRPEERTPLTTDPILHDFVSRILDSYPETPPNRTDINPRALNTNAPQTINNDIIGGRLDLMAGDKNQLSADYRFTKQAIHAFQLVRGQNPNTTTGSHDARLTWTHNWSPETTSNISAGFKRITSLILQDETAFGPLIFSGRQLETIGGSSSAPYNRAQNFTRTAGAIRSTKGKHNLVAGFGFTREQLNGLESSGHMGMIMFNANFGRDMITNLRLGTPSTMSLSIGNTHRGFRRWRMDYFLGDRWSVGRNLTLSTGLRFEPVTRPIEVNGLSELPYSCDCNNFAPRFGFAYKVPGIGILRGAYGLHYGEIFTATYSQERFNPPGNIRLSISAPDLTDPLAGSNLDSLDPNARSTVLRISPDLVAPYSHQYNFSWEISPSRRFHAQLGYLGSRTHRLFAGWVFNRARQVEGVPFTTSTVNDRRPDSRFFEVRRTVNGSRAYYDAAKASLRVSDWQGLSFDFSYWFSKALDLGAHYASNASRRDAYAGRSQSEFEAHHDVKGYSSFDQPHAAMWRVGYRTPNIGSAKNHWNKALGGWDLFSVLLFKTGTPFNISTGSDSPGLGNGDGTGGDRPHILNPEILGRSITHPDTSAQLLPRSAFSYIQIGELRGNIARNAFRKDGIQNINFALSRSWKLASESTITFKAESINFLNTPQFASPGLELSGGNFGQITNTLNDGRTFNFTLRLSF